METGRKREQHHPRLHLPLRSGIPGSPVASPLPILRRRIKRAAVAHHRHSLLDMLSCSEAALWLLCALLAAAEAAPAHWDEDLKKTPWSEVTRDAATRDAVQRLLRRMHGRACATPVAKVFAVGALGDEYGEYSGQYRPSCVELWRCANDTGCCAEANETCGPADAEIVRLPLTVGLPGQPARTLLVPFLNHTRCACQSTLEDDNYIDER